MSENFLEQRVLALKYRPKKFQDLIGQNTVSQTLSLALNSNRLSHAYLFSGLRGSGKTSTARIMAKALLCEQGPTSTPCEQCSNCQSANSNKHLDIVEMDAASNRGIDDIKDLIEHTKYKPSSARFKVFIIDEVHMLTTQAFNALLKTLEEPPGFVKFILATTDPLKLPATILSRTQHFRFNKISNSDVVHHLANILSKENIKYEKDALEILSRSGQGSLRDTLTLLDQAIIFSKGNVTNSSVVEMLGFIDPKVMDDIFDSILERKDINPIVKKLQDYEVSLICDEMSIYLKNKMLQKDSKFDILLYDRFFRIIGDTKHLLALNSDSDFALILMLLKMGEATHLKTIDEIINEVEQIEVEKKNVVVEKKELIKKEEKPVINTIQEDKINIETNSFSTPFDDFIKQDTLDTSKEDGIIKTETTITNNEEIARKEDTIEDELFAELKEKIYDRDYDLGECFEKNFIYGGFSNNILKILSYAQDEDRKFLFKHFSIIKMFIYDVYGENVELDFIKKEQKKNDELLENTNTSFTIKEDNITEKKELQIDDILNSKMLDKAKELFDIKKITVKKSS